MQSMKDAGIGEIYRSCATPSDDQSMQLLVVVRIYFYWTKQALRRFLWAA